MHAEPSSTSGGSARLTGTGARGNAEPHGTAHGLSTADHFITRTMSLITTSASWAAEPANVKAHTRPITLALRFATRDDLEITMNFRHVHRRRVQRLVRPQADDEEDEARREMLLPGDQATRRAHQQVRH